jgi:hypothetical protein
MPKEAERTMAWFAAFSANFGPSDAGQNFDHPLTKPLRLKGSIILIKIVDQLINC